MTTGTFEDPLVERAARLLKPGEPAPDPRRSSRAGDLVILADASGATLAIFRVRPAGKLRRLRPTGATRRDG